MKKDVYKRQVVPNENEAAVLLGCKSYSEVTENALQKFVQAFDIGCMVITLGRCV